MHDVPLRGLRRDVVRRVVVQPRHQGLERVPQLRGGRHVVSRADARATRVTDSGQCGSLGRGYRRRLARRAAWLRRGKATPGADARFARARAPGARSGVPRGPRGLFAEFQPARQKKGGSDASSGVASSKSDRGRTGDFEARARVRGRVLFLDPARAIRGSATPRRSAPVATPASLDSISSQPTALGARGAGTRPSGGGRRRVRATRRRFARDVRRAGGVRGVRVRVGAMEGAGWGRRAPDGEGDAGARSPRSRGGDRARRLERRRRVLADRAIATRRPGIRARGVGRRARDARVPRPGRRRASPRPARHPARS